MCALKMVFTEMGSFLPVSHRKYLKEGETFTGICGWLTPPSQPPKRNEIFAGQLGNSGKLGETQGNSGILGESRGNLGKLRETRFTWETPVTWNNLGKTGAAQVNP